LTRTVRIMVGRADESELEVASTSEPDAMRKYVGFVSQEKVGKEDTAPNIARGKGCWGIIVPEGSESPGRM